MPPRLNDWLATVEDEQRWLMHNLVPADSFILISADQKSGKTWFLLLEAIHMALGMPFQGHEVIGGPKKILFVNQEGSKASTKDRILGLCRGMDIAPDRLSNIFFHHRQLIKLDERQSSKELLAQVKDIEPDFVIFDPFYHLMLGDENKVQDVNRGIDTLRHCIHLGASISLAVHTKKKTHYKLKDGEQEFNVPNEDDEVRGSTAIVGNYDKHLAFRGVNKDDPNVIKTTLKVLDREGSDQIYNIKWVFKSENRKLVTAKLFMTLKTEQELKLDIDAGLKRRRKKD